MDENDEFSDEDSDSSDIPYELSKEDTLYQEEKNQDMDASGATARENIHVRPIRNRREPQRFIPTMNATTNVISIAITTDDEPSLSTINSSTPAEKWLWLQSVQEELDALNSNKAWAKIEDLSKEFQDDIRGRKALPTHMVYKIKRNSLGKPVRFRLCKSQVVITTIFTLRWWDLISLD